jgi:hypothetical protein
LQHKKIASIVRNDFIKIAYNEKGLAKVGYLENVKLGTGAGFCFVVDVYYFCLALFVEPEQKLIANKC